MKSNTLQSDLLLLLGAFIWGFAFVFQRMGMDYIGPFTFNGIRFALGAGMLYLFIITLGSKRRSKQPVEAKSQKFYLKYAGLIAGVFVFAGASFQQVGLVYTTAGNAGFITGLYVIFVPMMGLFFRQKPGWSVWVGALMAAVGLYFLSIQGKMEVSKGDFYVLICALFWAGHVIFIGKVSPQMSALKLAIKQYFVCSVLSLIVAVIFETITLQSIIDATIPILYGGLISVGIAYTLQIIGQKKAPPAHAAIILSMEGVFAVLGGWLILNEEVTGKILFGCILMLSGMLLAQWQLYGKKKVRKQMV